MAVDIYLDPQTGDIALENNVMRLTQNIQESSRQQVAISLGTFKGEWLFNILAGIPWLANDNNPIQLLGKDGNKNLIDMFIKEDILNRENITEILSYSSEVNIASREMSVSFQCLTNFGEVITVDNLTVTQ